ncbi:Acg family FMN-binding oxidoreductase [Nonomuraea sp. NPDC049480]|uniref:Acg family FMN-binding oxidoreductase n=1 Tax=Nonomuraea sp. NPDC049480 TaxID=3364353 RepID=UPI00378A7E79
MVKPFATPSDVRRIVEAAVAAPSVHNTQPWLFYHLKDSMTVYADLRRQLHVTDPLGRCLGMSCGAALFNMRLTIRMTGYEARVLPLPAPRAAPDLLAVIRTVQGQPPSPNEQRLHAVIPHRRTNRFPFDGRSLPRNTVVDLVLAARQEGATLVMLDGRAARRVLDMVATADRALSCDEAYRCELAPWTRDGLRAEGVPRQAFGPRPDGTALPLRDFGLGASREVARFERDPQIAALFTDGDSPRDWLVAGQALQRVLLTATAHGVSASLFSQPLDLPDSGHRGEPTGTLGHLQMLLRLGYGPPVPAVPRRPLHEVFNTRAALTRHR